MALNIQAPSYTSDLGRGHSYDCRNLEVAAYPDLLEEIKRTAERVKESLLDLTDIDIEFANEVDWTLNYLNLDSVNYESLLYKLSQIQKLLGSSGLDEASRVAFWAPIAECYAKVQSTLKDRIIPLEQRQLIKLGETVNIPVRVRSNGCNVKIHTDLPPFAYALERKSYFNPPSKPYLEDCRSMSFRDDYLDQLPKEVRNGLRGVTELPLKVVSESPGMITFVEIDIPAFLASIKEAV